MNMSAERNAVETLIVSKYFQGLAPLTAEYIKMFKTNDFPKPGPDYKTPFATEQLTSVFNSSFNVSRLLNKNELAAEESYVNNIRDWLNAILEVTDSRHKQELQILHKQLQTFLHKKAVISHTSTEEELPGKNSI